MVYKQQEAEGCTSMRETTCGESETDKRIRANAHELSSPTSISANHVACKRSRRLRALERWGARRRCGLAADGEKEAGVSTATS